ncbi:Aste57867_11245 [Aphanomyces stellatus]|uniref:DNA ligase 1 n=1 Tax=Aphanomyces stellatus TaxID=120398 RepID=A0A485KSU8_9STRA|nr:hypothetical protein As57867_011203 [Aphanomyces stellatus]VFT88111.1 Aste57867_11245 [Aphanomyces stellatus]
MLFRDLAATFRRIQMKNSRDASIVELSVAFRAIRDRHPAQLPKAMYLVTSQLAPTHEGVELRFRDKTFAPVLKSAFANDDADVDQAVIFDMYKKTGDYGTAVETLLKDATLALEFTPSTAGDDAMTIDAVYDQLRDLALQSGKGSTQRKQDIAVALLKRCSTVDEAAYLARLLAHQNLRIGVGAKSVVTALAHAFASPEAEKPSLQPWISSVAAAYAQRPIFEDLVDTLAHPTLDNLSSLDDKAQYMDAHASPKPGTPIQTMLGYPVSSLHEVSSQPYPEITLRMGKYTHAACEYKYDGARLQIHMPSMATWKASTTGLAIFSRNMERIPEDHKYYTMVAASILPLVAADVESFIVEGEMVAVDGSTLLPFQTLQTTTNTSMRLFAFDCLYRNGTSLLHRPFRERRVALQSTFAAPTAPTFEFVRGVDLAMDSCVDADRMTQLEEVLQAAVNADCEGLMVKSLDEPYKAGARTHTWLKVKRDYLPTLSSDGHVDNLTAASSGIFLPDTLDLVPIAAFRGKGRRAAVFGSFLMACYDPTTLTFQTVGKVGSGFGDAELAAVAARLDATQVAVKPLEYRASETKSIQPDVWFAPTEVWEIRAAQLTRSAQYTAGSDTNTKGLGLRFPRFLQVRHDKRVADATSADQLREWMAQATSSQPDDIKQPDDSV